MGFYSLILSILILRVAFTLPDPPQVKVYGDLLHRFGVLTDVNQPGYFTRLIAIEPSSNSSDPNVRAMAVQAKEVARIIAQNFMNLPAVEISRRLIEAYRPLKEGPLIEFGVAHLLSAYTRVFDILTLLNVNTLRQFANLQESTADVARLLCENNEETLVAAIQYTHNAEPKSACTDFVAMVSKNKTIIPLIMGKAATAHGAQHHLNYLLTNDERSTISNALDFILNTPVFPEMLATLFIQREAIAFSDYANFVRQIETSAQARKVITMMFEKDAIDIASRNFMDILETSKSNAALLDHH